MHPRDAAQQATDQHDRTWPEPIDEVAFDRHQPGFREHEDRERDLDRRAAPAIFVVDRIDEQGPAVLQVGDHRHADDADEQAAATDRTRAGKCPSTIVPFWIFIPAVLGNVVGSCVSCSGERRTYKNPNLRHPS